MAAEHYGNGKDLPATLATCLRVCHDLEQEDLGCFREDGTYGDQDGEEIILIVLEEFEYYGMSNEATYIKDFLKKYRARFKSVSPLN